jgi:glucose/arabinose dehydrogenase
MRKLLLLFILAVFACNAHAQMTTRIVRDSLFIPWEMIYGPDNHIWFTQKNGYICRLNPDTRKIDTLYHETNTVIRSEGGMLGMALHPQFPATPHVFVAYNYVDGTTYKERIVKYEYNGTVLNNPQTILDDIDASNIHNGCRLLTDANYLYITTGDASATSNSQDVNSINGKTLRVNFDGSIPADNPIAGNPAWSWGHRNAQGMVMVNGKIFQSEHGDNSDDEINLLEKGRNYGWPNVKGYCDLPTETTFCTDSNVREPLRAWTPTLAVCGIDYYNQQTMFPAFQNSIIMATLKDSKLYQLKLNTAMDTITSATVISGVSFGRLRDVCISPQGKIYISTSNSNASGSTRTDKIIELYDPSSVSISNTPMNTDINIYPNPANDELFLHLGKASFKQNLKYQIYNTAGQVVVAGNMPQPLTGVRIQHIPAGLYQLVVTDGNNILTRQKVVKE